MAITSGFFDSENGDRTYDAEQMSNYFDGLVSNGVYESIGDRFLVTAGSGLTVNVGSGRAIIQSRWVKNDDAVTLSVDPADSQYNRVDAVVLRLDLVARSISLVIKKGTASASPAIPAITRNENVYELYLAAVQINRGSSNINTITDLRPSTYCGWVTGIVQQVDTSDLFLQFQIAYEQQFALFDAYMQQKEAAFNEWFMNLTGQLRVDASLTKIQFCEILSSFTSGAYVPLEYNEGTDVLLVFANGQFFAEGYDYDIVERPHISNKWLSLKDGKGIVGRTEVVYVILRTLVGQGVVAGGLNRMSVEAISPMTAGQLIQLNIQ